MTLGAQLYTLREYTRTLEGLSETLRRVADIGYTTVQVSGTCAYDGAWLQDELNKTRLRCVITHTDPARMRAEPEKVAAEHQVFDCRYIGIGSMPGGTAAYDAFLKDFKAVGKSFARHGCLLMYHNHDMEFAKSDSGQVYLARMAEDFQADEMGFTLDTYWIQAGGGDPAWWIRKLSGRADCIHLKDMAYDGGMRMAPVCEGNMNFDAILSACEDAGTRYLLVEQDDCYGDDPFDCLRRSYRNLKAMGL